MTRKVYRTAQGKLVDLGALQLQNEHVRAVGNMDVNARGDLIDSQDKPISTRNQQVASQYKKQVTNTQDSQVYSSKASQQSQSAPVNVPEEFDNDAEKSNIQPESFTNVGLAGAIARSRQVSQEQLKTPKQIAQLQSGVKKI